MVRGNVVLVRFDPTVGSEVKKTRPAVIVSPDELNRARRTLLVVPLTSKGFAARYRPSCTFGGKSGQLATDQMRTIDKTRVLKNLGALEPKTLATLLDLLQEMFAP